MYFDAHNHLHDAVLAPHRAAIFAALAATGVERAVANGSSESDWADVATLAAEHPAVLPSYGLHPWDVGNRTAAWEKNLRARLEADPSAGVGEIGLDRWMLDRARPDDPNFIGLRRAPIAEQTEAFLFQLALAAEGNRAASIHCLDAHGLLHDLLRAAKLPARGFLLHSYNGSVEMVAGFVKLGAYFSFNGAFLDPRRLRLREVYAAIPAERLLVETDAPATRLPPDREKFPPLRAPDGSPANHPANLAAAYAGLAEIRSMKIESLAGQVEKNFRKLFEER